MIEVKAVVLVVCDECGKPALGWNLEDPAFFESVAEARRVLTEEDYGDEAEGWRFGPDGSHTCLDCLADADDVDDDYGLDELPSGRSSGTGPGYAGWESCDCGFTLSWPDGTAEQRAMMLQLWAEHESSCEHLADAVVVRS